LEGEAKWCILGWDQKIIKKGNRPNGLILISGEACREQLAQRVKMQRLPIFFLCFFFGEFMDGECGKFQSQFAITQNLTCPLKIMSLCEVKRIEEKIFCLLTE